MFIEALLTVVRKQSQPKCLLFDKWIMNIYATMEKNQSIKLVGKWMELEIILSEVTEAWKDKHHMFSLIYGSGP